ncbi:MAG: hypothetical protein ABIQ84_10065 [Usitatibacter sp.]
MRSTATWIVLSAAALAAPAAAGKEHLIDVVWGPDGEYKTELRVAPGKFKELCVPLKKGERVEWSFSSPVDTSFNIHYHVGSEVSYPAKVDGIRTAQGTLEVKIDQDYCWLWKAGAEPAQLAASLKLHPERHK